MFSLEMAFIPKAKWCVYAHYDLNKNLAYIGMGAPHRAFTRERRTKKWHDSLGDGFYVSILGWHDSKKDALTREASLIRELNPRCNHVHTGKAHSSLFGNKWNIGRKHTAEAKEKMSNKARLSWKNNPNRSTGVRRQTGFIRCIETGKIYHGLRDASKHTGFCPSHLSNCINGVVPHAGGYHFVREAD